MWWIWLLNSDPDLRRTHPCLLVKVATTANTDTKVANSYITQNYLISFFFFKYGNVCKYLPFFFSVQATVTKDTGTLTSHTAPQVVRQWMTSCTAPSCPTHLTCPAAWWHKTSPCRTTCPNQWVPLYHQVLTYQRHVRFKLILALFFL